MERRNFLKGLTLLAACPLCVKAGAAEDAQWGYKGEDDPENWGKLDMHYSACAVGLQQSPLNITGAIKAEIPELVIDWKKGGHMENNGHTILVNPTPGGTLRRGEKAYELMQYHFHAPSEHLVEGQHFPMEVHFVHKDPETGALGVLGVFIRPGKANGAFAELAAVFPTKAQGAAVVEDIDPCDLLPSTLAYWVYEGSLTTPPCSETVDWMVAMEPIEVDEADIARFTAIYSMNARPALAENRRYILRSM